LNLQLLRNIDSDDHREQTPRVAIAQFDGDMELSPRNEVE
jgi:hypothetical protein